MMVVRHIVVHKTVTCIYCTPGIKLEDQLVACIQSVRRDRYNADLLACCYTALQEYFTHRNGTKEKPKCLICKVETHGL